MNAQKPARLSESPSHSSSLHRAKAGQAREAESLGGEAAQTRGSHQQGLAGKCPAVVSDFQESESVVRVVVMWGGGGQGAGEEGAAFSFLCACSGLGQAKVRACGEERRVNNG